MSLTTSYSKALAMPLLRRMPGLTGSHGLPDTTRELPDHIADPDRLAAYREVCGFERDDRLPATWPHVVAFPMAMDIMTRRSFPFTVLGLVHIGNEIDQLRPIAPDEPLSLRVQLGDLEDHPRGTKFAVQASGSVDDKVVWQSRNVYLKRGGGSGERSASKSERSGPAPARAHWRVLDDIGRRYAAVSGDRNPIHMHPLSARLFGMPRPIAHGMWVKARCLAELERELPDAFSVEVAFKLPLFLPAQVAFGVRDGGAFEVRDAASGKPHLSGSLSSA